jgi:CDP-diacylglycerol--serine O-phosphatidyltransferase
MKIGRPRRRIRELPINQFLPNVVTVLALCTGLTAVRFGIQERWELAVVAVLVAAVLDSLDGRLARRIGATTKFGAELDSLSDFLCFGVTPALLVFLWTLQFAGGAGWVLALFFAVCAALRLARFNTRLGISDLPPWAGNFFTGVPAPAGAGAVLLPMMCFFEWREDIFRHPIINSVVVIVVGSLMISRLPTFSFKNVKVPHRWVLPGLMIVGLLAAFIATSPWATLSVMMLVYLMTIPVAVFRYRSLQAASAHPPAADVAYVEEAEERAFEPLIGAETDDLPLLSDDDAARRDDGDGTADVEVLRTPEPPRRLP